MLTYNTHSNTGPNIQIMEASQDPDPGLEDLGSEYSQKPDREKTQRDVGPGGYGHE